MTTTTTRVSKIWAPNAGEFRIALPRFEVGDQCRVAGLKGTRIPGGADVVVEQIDGPYLGHSFDRSDAFLYRVYEPETGLRYPVEGKNLKVR